MTPFVVDYLCCRRNLLELIQCYMWNKKAPINGAFSFSSMLYSFFVVLLYILYRKNILTFKGFWANVLVTKPKDLEQEPLKMNITKKIEKRIRQNEIKVNPLEEKKHIEDTGEILIDIKPSGRKENWSKLKIQSRRVWKLFKIARETIDPEIISADALQRLYESGDILTFKCNYTKGTRKLHQAWFSRNKFDPLSAHRKGILMFAQTSRVMDKILEQAPNTRFIFLTCTTKNVKAPDVSKEVDRYYTAFRRIFGTGKEVIADARKFNRQIDGTIKELEVTYREVSKDTYHLHAHLILAVKPTYFLPQNYMTQKKMRELWAKAADLNYDPFVFIETIKGHGQALKKAVAEISKYPTKPTSILSLSEDLGAEVLANLQRALFNRRLITFTGIFRKVRRELKLQDIEAHNLIHIDEEGISEDEQGDKIEFHIFRWSSSLREYVCLSGKIVDEMDTEEREKQV